MAPFELEQYPKKFEDIKPISEFTIGRNLNIIQDHLIEF